MATWNELLRQARENTGLHRDCDPAGAHRLPGGVAPRRRNDAAVPLSPHRLERVRRRRHPRLAPGGRRHLDVAGRSALNPYPNPTRYPPASVPVYELGAVQAAPGPPYCRLRTYSGSRAGARQAEVAVCSLVCPAASRWERRKTGRRSCWCWNWATGRARRVGRTCWAGCTTAACVLRSWPSAMGREVCGRPGVWHPDVLRKLNRISTIDAGTRIRLR